MKSIALAIAGLTISVVAHAGTMFHVRTDGSDTGCDGRADAAAGAGSCAFQTGQKAVDTIVPGDDVMLHAGTYAPFALRAVFRATAADPTVIEGDPAIDRSSIRIEGGTSTAAIYSAGGTSTSTRSRFITIRHLSIGGGTNAGVYLDGEHDDVALQDLYLDDFVRLGGSATGTTNGGRHAPSPRDAAIIYNWGERALFEDLQIVGGAYYCAVPQGGGSLCGVDASAISMAAGDSTVRHVEASDFLGNFLLRAPPNGIVENCVVRRFGCDSDDGCIQLYNTPNVVIRHNLFVDTTPINETMGVIRMRRTSPSTAEPSAQIYNNTFIGNTTAGLLPRVLKKAIEIASPVAAASYGPTMIKNNIFMQNYGDSDSTGSALSVLHCPTTLDVDHDLYFNNIKDYSIDSSCVGSFETHAVFADPMLDVNLAPMLGSPACGAGEGGVDIGALPCGYVPGTPPDGIPPDAGENPELGDMPAGCGCRTHPGGGSALAMVLVVLAVTRRRRGRKIPGSGASVARYPGWMRGSTMVMVAMLAIGALVGCVKANTADCGDLLCPSSKVCDGRGGCVYSEQLSSCAKADDGTDCTYHADSEIKGTCLANVCIEKRCGNGLLTPDEVCDDGNADPGDGCSNDCLSLETCGNRITDLATGEECDDGNTIETDTCHSNCRRPICGDGLLDPGEECDAGVDNSDIVDGACRSSCQKAGCGDHVTDLTLGEVCDDGNTDDELPSAIVRCSANCLSDETCRNGVTDTIMGEQCDDGNSVNTDACRNNCQPPGCGDGILDIGEECDDGSNNADVPNAACRTTCVAARCSDLIIDDAMGEVCDDGDNDDGDGCSANCRSDETCGNHIVDINKTPPEQCDDGNTADDDSCHTDCKTPTCGDHIIDPQLGEVCDFKTFPPGVCPAGGIPSCVNACTTIDTSACFQPMN